MRTRILIVEDDPTQAAVLARMLEAHACFVQVAADGREALRWLKVGIFDAAVVDYAIPEIDGLAVARVARDVMATRAPVLVAVTAMHGAARARLDGRYFDAVFAKPVPVEAMLARIGERLAARGGEQPEPAARPAPPTGRAGPERVLIVDDDIVTGHFLAQALTARGFAAVHVESGFDALGRCGAEAFDAVVMDYHMPEMNGLVAAELIAEHRARPMRPVMLALTVQPRRLVSLEFQQVTVFDGILDKSQGVAALVAVLERCLAYRRLRLGTPGAEVLDLAVIERIAAARGDVAG